MEGTPTEVEYELDIAIVHVQHRIPRVQGEEYTDLVEVISLLCKPYSTKHKRISSSTSYRYKIVSYRNLKLSDQNSRAHDLNTV